MKPPQLSHSSLIKRCHTHGYPPRRSVKQLYAKLECETLILISLHRQIMLKQGLPQYILESLHIVYQGLLSLPLMYLLSVGQSELKINSK